MNAPVANGVTEVVVVSGDAVVVADVTDVVSSATALCEAVSDESVVTETVRSPTPAVVAASVLSADSDNVSAAVCNGVTEVSEPVVVVALMGAVIDGVPSAVVDVVGVTVLSAVTVDDTAVVVSGVVVVAAFTTDDVVVVTVRSATPPTDAVSAVSVSTGTETLRVPSDTVLTVDVTDESVSVDAVFGRATVSVSGPETSVVVVVDAVTDCCVSVASWKDALTVESVVVGTVFAVDVNDVVVVEALTVDVATVVSETVS